MWNAQLIEKPNTITVPNFPTVWIYDRLFIPFTASSCCETEYLWFFSKRLAAPLPLSTDNSIAALVVFYTNHTESVWHLITSFVVKAHFENSFVKRLLPVFKYFPFSKEKAPKELTNLLALHIYEYPLTTIIFQWLFILYDINIGQVLSLFVLISH